MSPAIRVFGPRFGRRVSVGARGTSLVVGRRIDPSSRPHAATAPTRGRERSWCGFRGRATFGEGFPLRYNTKSVARVLMMYVLEELIGSSISCPKVVNPFEQEDLPLESYEDDAIAKPMLSTTVEKLKQFVFGEMSPVEAATIIVDPRLKRQFFDDLQILQNKIDDPQYTTNWQTVCDDAVAALKVRLTKAIENDEALHNARPITNNFFQQTRAPAAPAPATAPAPPPVAPTVQPPRQTSMRSGFAARMRQRGAPGDDAGQQPTTLKPSATTRAANDVDASATARYFTGF